ncbi:hypothetical protein HWV62_12980 [Athelia sp. TMB]|nr:hypothetical protein HWV62_21782 [Athelia sp. TMB]KAF7984691.1 hypothetical protein HWV62_12980 [Athelia sp. TMB]
MNRRYNRKMVLGYACTNRWATEYALDAGFEQNFLFCTAMDVSARAKSSKGEGPLFLTIEHKGNIYPFFAVQSTDPNDDIFPGGPSASQAECIEKLKEIMGKTRPPTWYRAY